MMGPFSLFAKVGCRGAEDGDGYTGESKAEAAEGGG